MLRLPLLSATLTLPIWSVVFVVLVCALGTWPLFARALCEAQHPFIDTLAACGSDYVLDKRAYANLRVELSTAIEEARAAGDIRDASIYFRDLRGGPTLGLNEHEPVVPSRLLKLVLLIAYLDYAQENPGLMERELVIEGVSRESEDLLHFPSRERVVAGERYRVPELLERMVRYSDNLAYETLHAYLTALAGGGDLIRAEAQELGIEPESADTNSVESAISVKTYASIFHNLYFARLLPPAVSEGALALLATTEPVVGLVAGVPVGTPVAHRFSERTLVIEGVSQLGDCGVIYYPQNPYSLCVVVSGSDTEAMASFIRNTSAKVYAEVKSRALVP